MRVEVALANEDRGLTFPPRIIGEILKRKGLVRKYRVKRVMYKYSKAKLTAGELVEILT